MASVFQKILLTTDLSADALRAFAPVTELARKLGSRITLMHVLPDLVLAPHGDPLAAPVHAPVDPIGQIESMTRDVTQRLEEDARRHFPGLDVEVYVTSEADVARAITRHAKENGFDLIALSSHGRTGFRRMVLGSVAEAVLRHAEVPVLCFPRHG
jgi:nucleotide-binding universal stress UspA family protein